jgi:hypothetical protein
VIASNEAITPTLTVNHNPMLPTSFLTAQMPMGHLIALGAMEIFNHE